MQLKVTNSPFNQEQVELLHSLLTSLSDTQKIWLSGYLAASAEGPVAKKEVTILYGSQTGNSQGLAKKAGKFLEENGIEVTVSSMSEFKPTNLKKIQNLLLIVSTHGEGVPPDNALTFHEFLHSKRAPKLEDLHYSVLALGDSSYEFFCQTGKEFDARLEELGATRLYKRIDCDLDYEGPAGEWLEGVLGSVAETQKRHVSIVKPEISYTRTNPFHAEVLENINLNGRGSNKETRHLELSLEGSGLTFKPGDSLGVFPENDPALVKLLLEELKWDPNEIVQGDVSLQEALLTYFEITVVTKPLLEKINQFLKNEKISELLGEKSLKSYLEGRDLLDIVREYGRWGDTAQEFVSILRKIPARLYSIASSQAANPDEVHLTIGAVRYQAHERERKGVCSTFCAERLQPGDKVRVFTQPNENFKLPMNPDTPIIMVGPGTGVAPFRAFMQEREEIGAKGKSWLFLGDQHFVTDFLYQTEWQKWLQEGVLTKMNVAFSRDSAEKVYVQQRMLEESKELFKWLQEGAVFYLCGDKKEMARAVQETLLTIIEIEGGMKREQAEAYLADLKKQNRYQRDVY
ncbi:assimilatory sulfite reductase (NADPH) flavoprotein subunit [Anaerobacillus sp. CMMVII]|uniref:assimilatory sulfite reductase (NADPH) flavoprotein subunit n=1 Tax=Anaerobacillus sp. CMMVII TaxID=2755588 RepID=UPI0021B7D199|nr:assimilatory sulfite reductase (NADPH) flavoprotein subunit [Anaerobacillus sp. CMMVII]MCT8137635.1 assimilatory sulfite reductase (NADPH) flavoprotein subunit [Anaerobacillus sp. CMMVII]